MDRSTYPNQVEVDQTALANTETTKSFHIRQRGQDFGVQGVIAGTITVSALDTTRVDVTTPRGYAPNNELIESATIAGVALTDYTNGVDNYVCLVYSEALSRPEGHATDRTSRTTIASRSSRIRVFTLTQLTALTPSSADMNVDARDRTMVVGIVNANGLGVPLTTADITSPASNARIIAANQPVSITGVVIAVIDPTIVLPEDVAPTLIVNPTPLLRYIGGATPPSTATLAWRAPGETVLGSAVVVGAGGTFVLTSGGKTMTVEVTIEVLPFTTGTVDDNISVRNLYYNSAARASAKDDEHRHVLGTGLPSVDNPHGIRTRDIADPIVEARQTVLAGTGLMASSLQAFVPRLLTRLSSFGGRTLLWYMDQLASTRRLRMYLTASAEIEFTVNARWDGALWNKDDGADAATRFRINGFGGVECHARATGAGTWAESAWTSNTFFVTGLSGADSTGDVGTQGRIIAGANLNSTTTRQLQERILMEHLSAGSLRTLLFRSVIAATPVSTVRIYRAVTTLAGGQSDAFEIVLNAVWDHATATWSKDTAGTAACKIEIGKNVIQFAARVAGSGGTFTDVVSGAGWDSGNGALTWTSGTFALSGTLSAAAVSAYSNGLVSGGSFLSTLDAPATPVANTLYRDNVAKAGATIDFNTTATPDLNQEYNITTVSCDTVETTVNLATSMADGNYRPLIQMGVDTGSIAAGDPFHAVVTSRTTSNFTFRLLSETGAVVNPQSATATDWFACVEVFGKQ